MTNSLQRLVQSIDKLEEIIAQNLSIKDEPHSEDTMLLHVANDDLKKELQALKDDYKKLQETSKDVINELNNSIQIIEDYFKKQNANN